MTQNYEKAKEWWQKAADQGYIANAQFNLGVMYARGEGVTQDFKKAKKWWQKAADQGLCPKPNTILVRCMSAAAMV